MQGRLRPEQIPRHVAIIMDGSGRWAERRGMSRIEGHHAGLEALRAVVRGAHELGVGFLTLYAFSLETEFKEYEAVQADIFDHLLSILPKFELRAFQNVTDPDAST